MFVKERELVKHPYKILLSICFLSGRSAFPCLLCRTISFIISLILLVSIIKFPDHRWGSWSLSALLSPVFSHERDQLLVYHPQLSPHIGNPSRISHPWTLPSKVVQVFQNLSSRSSFIEIIQKVSFVIPCLCISRWPDLFKGFLPSKRRALERILLVHFSCFIKKPLYKNAHLMDTSLYLLLYYTLLSCQQFKGSVCSFSYLIDNLV